MTIYVAPSFAKGLETLCSTVALLSFLKVEGGDGPISLQLLIKDPMSYFPEMIALQHERVKQLDGSNREVAKVQSLWNKLHSPATSISEFWFALADLEKWVKSYASPEQLPTRLSETFKETPLVFVSEGSALPSNAIHTSKIESLIQLLDRIQQFLTIKHSTLKQTLSILLSFAEGRELLTDIANLIETDKLILTSGDESEWRPDSKTIALNLRPETIIYECPNPHKPGDRVLKSLRPPLSQDLAHELLHCLHNLQKKKNEEYKTDPDKEFVYTDSEEYRTVHGTPTSQLCESSIATAMGLFPRYGHIGGNDLTKSIKSSINHALDIGINGDWPWIVKSIPAPFLAPLFQAQKREMKEKLSAKRYARIKEGMRKQVVQAKLALAQSPPLPTIVRSESTLSETSERHLRFLDEILTRAVLTRLNTEEFLPTPKPPAAAAAK